ncbi:PREDICTED: insulin-like growth factor-binding protein complex acid labile subunit [Dinoponera quadriceps]|uniref:Insulin-like growth factor-binding protein complex acid labile subunit n=1 Tax=Dinoponera quadriceps TaxID=609295 RepID=A0A6P3XR09_DINQU|nr:PREDICTED: insulin-like growth factor-binding protein complex acid labile subunit [Dinoponera quadriceps]
MVENYKNSQSHSCFNSRRSIASAMLRYLPLLSQVIVLVLSASVTEQKEAPAKVPTCLDVDGYNVCHYKGVLVDVTQRRFEDRLEIGDLDLLAIREDAFKNLTATHLYLNQGNRISVLKRESFRGLPMLKWLHLDSNVVPLSGHLFAELGNLQSLSLVFNKINSIPADSFAGLSKLTWLYLGHNDIASVDADSFSYPNPELLFLWLNNNKITRIEPGAFASLTELNRLYLDHNKLQDLQAGVFQGLNKLEVLYLNDNQLTSVTRPLFRGLVDLKKLYLQHNEISTLEAGTFQELSQLEQLYLGKNKLSHIVVGAFAGILELQVLDLSDNNIHTADNVIFEGLTKLRLLKIDSNSTEKQIGDSSTTPATFTL